MYIIITDILELAEKVLISGVSSFQGLSVSEVREVIFSFDLKAHAGMAGGDQLIVLLKQVRSAHNVFFLDSFNFRASGLEGR